MTHRTYSDTSTCTHLLCSVLHTALNKECGLDETRVKCRERVESFSLCFCEYAWIHVSSGSDVTQGERNHEEKL